MADNDVRIKVSLDGDKVVIDGLTGIGEGASQADSKIGGLITGGLKGAGAALIGFAGAATAAGAALSVGVTKAYADYEQNVGGIETMFKEASGTMMQYAADAYKTAGLSANQYMSQVTSFSASLLQGLGGDTAAAAEVANTAMVDMSDNANKFGSNIADIQNAYQGFAKQNFTMLDNLKLGYGGTQSEMARLINDSGVLGDTMTVTAETVNQVSFDKIIEAIHTMQDRMGIAGTTAKEATETISGSIGLLKGAFENLLTGLGSADADVATLAGNVITSLQLVITNITPVIENLGSNMAQLGPQLGTMMEGLIGAVSNAVPALLDAGVGLVNGLITGVTMNLPSLVTALVPGLVGLVNSLSGMLPSLVDAGADALLALAQGLTKAAPMLVTSATEALTGLVTSLVYNAPMLLEAGVQLIMALADGLLQSIPIIIESLPLIIEGVVGFITEAVPLILNAGIALFTGLLQALPQVITQLVAVLPTMITSIIGAIVGAIPLLVQAGVALLTALVTNLPTIITTIVAALPQIITSILNAVIGAIPVIIEGGIQLFIALIGALPQIIVTIVGAIPQIITGVIQALVGAIPLLIDAGVKLLVAIVQNLPAIIGGIVAAVPQIIGGLIGAIVGAIPQLVDAGFQLISGLWQGISGAFGWLMDKVGGFVNDVVGGIQSFFGINSPSRVLRDKVGQYLPSGIGAGVEKGEDEAIKPIIEMNKRIIAEAATLPTLAVSTVNEQRLTPAPVNFTATPTQSTGQGLAALSDQLVGLFNQEIQARVSSDDMATMAQAVKSGVENVRAADGRSAALSLKQEVR